MSRYLAVSYDPDEQQWFWDVVEAPENEAETVQEYVAAARPYVVAVDAVSLADLEKLVNRLRRQTETPDWNVADPLIECDDCGVRSPLSRASAHTPVPRCVDCGTVLQRKPMKYKPLDISNDCTLGALDDALVAAERALFPLLSKHSASEVSAAFESHIVTHLAAELSAIQSGRDPDGDLDDPLSVLAHLRYDFLVWKRWNTPKKEKNHDTHLRS